jgi:hypothetical protein
MYPGAESVFADAEATRTLANALYTRVQPIEGTPAEKYLIATRRIPVDAVRACTDLRYLPPPIEKRPPQDHAVVSLLRDAEGEVCGFQLEFIDISGAKTGATPSKMTFALVENGVRDGLFHAGGMGDFAYLCEGYSTKALALASLGLKAYGGGAMTVLGSRCRGSAPWFWCPTGRRLPTNGPQTARNACSISTKRPMPAPSTACSWPSRSARCWSRRRRTAPCTPRAKTLMATCTSTARSGCGI